MHTLPQLRKLEEKYAGELAVVGVHSAKFPAERETLNLRKAILRYDLRHPVINDRDFLVWRQYSVQAWPTLVFLDPVGKIIGEHAGELSFEAADHFVAEVLREFDAQGLIDRNPLSFSLEADKERARTLSFPGKLLADSASGRLFISDSNHHRILVATLDGTVRQAIGEGAPGFQDGGKATARFHSPQELALHDTDLYVADTENHAIRRIDLETGAVSTVAGTGVQALPFPRPGPALATPLNSPWGLTLSGGVLYIAMAGCHQLWALDLSTGELRLFAGAGDESLRDGPLPGAALAQPSGLASDGATNLYVADSEISSIRIADLRPYGSLLTLVGEGLFEFGDVDGVGEQVRLQHPLGLAYHDGAVYVADTYNHKVKRLLPRSRGVLTFLGTGRPGHRDGIGTEAQFDEPSGLSVADGKLYIADTNNHAIRLASLDTGEVATLELRGLA